MTNEWEIIDWTTNRSYLLLFYDLNMFCTNEQVLVCQGDCICTCSMENNFNSPLPRSAPSLCYVWNEQRPCLQCLQQTPESRAHCVVAEGEQRHFHWRNFGFLSIRTAVLWARAVFICLCTVGIYAAARVCTFKTTSGGCINSPPWRNIKGREKFPRDYQDF